MLAWMADISFLRPIAYIFTIFTILLLLGVASVIAIENHAMTRTANKLKDEIDKSGYMSQAYVQAMKAHGFQAVKDDYYEEIRDDIVVVFDGVSNSDIDSKINSNVKAGVIILKADNTKKQKWGEPINFIVFRKVKVPWPNLQKSKHIFTLKQHGSAINRGYANIGDPSSGGGYLFNKENSNNQRYKETKEGGVAPPPPPTINHN